MKKIIASIIIICILLSSFSFVVQGAKANTYSRPSVSDGPEHSGELINVIVANTTKVLIVTEGYGPLTGVSPVEDKDLWISVLSEIEDVSVDWFDGIPTFDLLAEYDVVIYDAGGYWYPLSHVTEPLKKFHLTGKPLIVVAPDINYDWHINGEPVASFTQEVLHIDGALGIMHSTSYDVYAGTGHAIESGLSEEIKIPAETSWPDCYDPSSDAYGALVNKYISETEFGVGSCSELPSYAIYEPVGLYSAVIYDGSESEGRVITLGFPPAGIETSLAKKLCLNIISYILGFQTDLLRLLAELNGLKEDFQETIDKFTEIYSYVMVKADAYETEAFRDIVEDLFLFAIGHIIQLPSEIKNLEVSAKLSKDFIVSLKETLQIPGLKIVELLSEEGVKYIFNKLSDMIGQPEDERIENFASSIKQSYIKPYLDYLDKRLNELIADFKQNPPSSDECKVMQAEIKRIRSWVVDVRTNEEEICYIDTIDGRIESAIAGGLLNAKKRLEKFMELYDQIKESIETYKYIHYAVGVATKIGGWIINALTGMPVGPPLESAGFALIEAGSATSIIMETITYYSLDEGLADIQKDAYVSFVDEVAAVCTVYSSVLDLIEKWPQKAVGNFDLKVKQSSIIACAIDSPYTYLGEVVVEVSMMYDAVQTACGSILLEVIKDSEILSAVPCTGITLRPDEPESVEISVTFPVVFPQEADSLSLEVVGYCGMYSSLGLDAGIFGPKTCSFVVTKEDGSPPSFVSTGSHSDSISTGESVSWEIEVPEGASDLHISMEYAGSELDLHLYDEVGNHVGVNYLTGETELNIPNAIYSGPDTKHEWIDVKGDIGGKKFTVSVVCLYSAYETAFSISYTVFGSPEIVTWEYTFEDPIRGTILRISTDDKCFEFIAYDKNFGVRKATAMYEGYVTVYYNGEYVELPVIIIRHNDGELRLLAYAGTEIPFCYARAVDYETGNRYMLRVDPKPPE